MAVAKRGTGHCLMLFSVLLLLATSGCTARDTITIGGGGSKGPKKPAHAQPPPPPDQGSHPAITAQKQPQELASAVTSQSRTSADAAVKGQLSGDSSLQDQQHASLGADMLAQQQPEQQLQQGADTQVQTSIPSLSTLRSCGKGLVPNGLLCSQDLRLWSCSCAKMA